MEKIRVYLLPLGYMWEPKTGKDFEESIGDLDKNPLKRTISYAVLIRHPKAQWILFDTGICSEPQKNWTDYILENVPVQKKPEHEMEYQLKQIGITPMDIKHVITSHMHFDHIGNDRLFAKTAEFYVNKKEAEYAYKLVMGSADREKHGWFVREDVLLERKAVHFIKGDQELFENVKTIELPGHTPGEMGLMVHLENKTLLFTSDAVKFKNNYDGEILRGAFSEKDQQQSIKKIKDLEDKYQAKVFFSHDEKMLPIYKMAPDFYE